MRQITELLVSGAVLFLIAAAFLLYLDLDHRRHQHQTFLGRQRKRSH